MQFKFSVVVPKSGGCMPLLFLHSCWPSRTKRTYRGSPLLFSVDFGWEMVQRQGEQKVRSRGGGKKHGAKGECVVLTMDHQFFQVRGYRMVNKVVDRSTLPPPDCRTFFCSPGFKNVLLVKRTKQGLFLCHCAARSDYICVNEISGRVRSLLPRPTHFPAW